MGEPELSDTVVAAAVTGSTAGAFSEYTPSIVFHKLTVHFSIVALA